MEQERIPPAGLLMERVTDNVFIHTSYKKTNDFGNVPCNGLVARHGGEAIVFDAPVNDAIANELLDWIRDTLRCRAVAVIPTHFHDDCLGGLRAFHARGIPSYAHHRTIASARRSGLPVPQHGFEDSLSLALGDEWVTAAFLGEGHTPDNVVGYVPGERVLFGGCLIKALDAGKGYLGDANEAAWPRTVEAVKRVYPDAQVVVPGHGGRGDAQLLDYTIRLFSEPD